MIKQLTSTEIKPIKEQILHRQGNKCAICGKTITLEEAVLDHQHKNKKTDANIINGNGLVRGILCRECNLVEGKIWNNLKRFKQFTTTEERLIWLTQLSQYYKYPKYPYIHPTEKLKEPIVSKRQFNKLCKLVGKQLVYPKSKKLTKPLEKLFNKYNINPYNS